MQYELSALSPGKAGVDETVKRIAGLVRSDLLRPELRLLASRILSSAGIPSKAHLSEARALYSWVVDHIRYQKDTLGVETVQSPLSTVRIGAGDCDDMSALYAGLVSAVGLPYRFRVVGYFADDLSHIWPEVLVAGKWWPADTTEPGRGFGWRPPAFPVEVLYGEKGVEMALGQTITRGQFRRRLQDIVLRHLIDRWQSGVVDLPELRMALDAIAGGQLPTQSVLVRDATMNAISEFVAYVSGRGGSQSVRAAGSVNGLGGLSGVLDDIWGTVKNAVVEIAPGVIRPEVLHPEPYSGPLIQISPTVQVPESLIKAEATEAAAGAAGAGFAGALLPVGLVLAVILLFGGK